MGKIAINASIFGHIELDSELSGRFGVQGNTFRNTFGYLSDYFLTLTSRPAKLDKLAAAMAALVSREDDVQRLNSRMQTTADLSGLCSNYVKDILGLSNGTDFMLPGGWSNHDGSGGHGMIYQFQKQADGALLFSIYNAGAGLEHHEKRSSISNEHFFPVKAYAIPTPVSLTELKTLLSRLILPMLSAHPDRAQQLFNEKNLYQNIEKSLHFLKARPVHADKLVSKHATTAGQISGTCAQRSIHQMLKINFDTLPEYQRFIFDFKLCALKDFINTHKPPRSRVITGLIQDAIINNLKILQQPGVFNRLEEQDKVVDELCQLQTLILTEEAAASTRPEHPPALVSFDWHINTSDMKHFDENALPLKMESSALASLPILDGKRVLEKLDTLIKCSKKLKDSDPMWVLEQIEQVVIDLPLPTRPIKHGRSVKLTDFYDDIPFYSEITQQKQLEDMGLKIEQLQQLYTQVTDALLNQTPLPHHLVTYCSLLALRDYFDVQQAKQHQKPSFHHAIHSALGPFLTGFKHCAYVATNHPEVDLRLKQLMSLYDAEYMDESTYYKAYYNALLDTEPALKEGLKRLYQQRYYASDPVLHSLLVEEQLTELYVLFQQLGENGELSKTSILNSTRFNVLVKKIQQQVRLEQFVTACFNPFLDRPKTPSTALMLTLDSKSLELKTPGCVANLSCNRFYDKITRHKYNLERSPAERALMKDYPIDYFFKVHKKIKMAGNTIQLSSNDDQPNRIINKDDFYVRELLHLRSSPLNQINFTLDYFQGQFNKLSSHTTQVYVEANIFEPGLLSAALDEDPDLLIRLDDFIQKGLQRCTNQDMLLNHEAIFYIRLSVYLHRYAAQYKPGLLHHLHNSHYLQDIQKRLSSFITTHVDPAILASLHAYRFLAVMALHSLHPDDALFKEALHSYFYIQAKSNPNRHDDTATRFERQRMEYRFRQWMQGLSPNKIDQLVRPLVKSIMESLGLDVSDLRLTGIYPRYSWENGSKTNVYTVNVEAGRVFKANKTYSVVPLDIQNHPMMRRLNLEQESSCFIWSDDRTFEFITPKRHVRIKRDVGGRLIVQKKWTLNGKTDWYELQPLTSMQEQYFGLGSHYRANFCQAMPAFLTDGSTEAWVHIERRSSFIARNQQPLYHEVAHGKFEQLDANNNGTGYVIQPCRNDLVHFESPNFISMCVDNHTKKEGTIHFVRYGLSLILRDEKISLPDSAYTLLPSEKSPFGPDVAALYFTDGTNQQCIVAVQPFYVDSEVKNKLGHYYRLKHDTSGHVATAQLEKNWKDSHLAEKDQPLWHYSDSASTITYKLVDGVPKPDTAADAFYLCYVYLGTHDIDKAWAVLDDLNQRLSLDGSMQELTYLSWIIHFLPVILDPKKERDAKLETPRYVACQLKALACYTDFLAQGKKPAIPIDATFDLKKANGHYQEACFKQAKAFYDGLPNTIYTLYTQLQRTDRHLEKKYGLPDSARKSLLNHYDPDLSKETPKALGSLGYEKRRLSLKTLLAEHNHLSAIQTSAPAAFPSRFAKRLAHIDSHLAKLLPVMKKSTVLALIPIDLSLPANISLNSSLYTPQTQALFSNVSDEKDWRWDVFKSSLAGTSSDAVAVLSSAIAEHDFMQHFPRYIEIACDPRHVHRKELLTFCEDYLKSVRHVSLAEQPSNIPYLTNVLYRLLHHPDCYKEDAYYTYFKKLPLSVLTSIVRNCPVPPIEVYQAKDVFQDVLATNDEIWQALKQATPVHVPMNAPVGVKPSLVSVLNPEMTAPLSKYRLEEEKYQDALVKLLMILPETPKPEQLRKAEQQAGELKYTCIQSQRKIARSMFSDLKARTDLRVSATRFQTVLKTDLKIDWDKALKLANQTPRDLNLARRFHIELASGQRYKLTKNDLRKLYLRADRAEYIEQTGLSIEQCDALHASLHQCVALDVQHQHVTRLLDALTLAEKSSDTTHLDQIASILMSENQESAQADPALMLFQYEENILLRPRQVDALTNLLSTPDDPYRFNESIEKVIMGGGKSKVILPLLAAKKATGLNLVVDEVPRALLATNHVDLNSTSQRLFHQKAHRFEFDRDSDCAPRRLEQIYQQFVEIMTNKDYLVTTGESMQSLELKYLELLLSRPEAGVDDEPWKQQVFWAGKITGLLKQSGDVVIDEVHQGLLLKKKLNYTLGTQQAIAPEMIRHSIMLYQFASILGQTPYSPDSLLDHPQSPLQPHIKQLCAQYGDDVMNELRDYLNNKADSTTIRAARPALRDAFAFYKKQLTLLPQTQSRHYKEHYGPSKQEGKSVLKRMLAIPYAANEKPNERSRFGDPLETINYSIQGMLQDGLNKDLLADVLTQWQREARYELQKNYTLYQQMDKTPTALGVAVYLEGTGYTLQGIDPKNEAQMSQLLVHLKHNKALIFEILETQVLVQVTTEPGILHSDAYNHADIYHTRQGLSGTPWNHTTYHQDLQFNHKTSLGTDGYIQAVLKGKKTPVRTVDFTTPKDYLKALFKGRKDIRAIIDVSATFAGLTNLDVANELVVFASKHQKDIKYVLYFNDADVLCALDVRNPKRPPIVLATSDPDEINRKLNCTPDDRLTYYDQAHTIGTDLKQAPNSRGMVLINEKTHLQSFLQGCMRMRGLDVQQTVEIIVPNDLRDKSFDELMNAMANNEQKQLADDNFSAALAKMENCVRQDFLKRLGRLDDDDVETKHQWALAFQRYFVDMKTTNLFEQFGAITREEDSKHVLEQYRKHLLDDWGTCLVVIKKPVTSKEKTQLGEVMQSVIDKSWRLCKARSMSRVKQGGFDLEVEVQKEIEMLKEQEQLEEEERFDPSLREEDDNQSITEALCQGRLSYTKTLNDLCKSALFSPDMTASCNYSNVYIGQKQMLGFYLKPVHAILFRMEKGKLTACIVSNQDAERIKQHLKETHYDNTWLSTTQHTQLAGNRPEGIMNQVDYQTLMEQIRFFSGDLSGLLEQKTPLFWMTEKADDKLAFFEKKLMPYRETTVAELNRLKSALSKKSEGFDYITQHALDDLNDFDWEREFPDALPADIAVFQSLAQAFAIANKQFQLETLSLDEFLRRFLLPPAAISCLKNHLDMLEQFKQWLRSIEQSSPDDLGFERLTTDQKGILNTMLGLDVDLLLKRHQCDCNVGPMDLNHQFLSLDLLMALINSPYVKNKDALIALAKQNPLLKDTEVTFDNQENIVIVLLDNPQTTPQQFERLRTYSQTEKTLAAQLRYLQRNPGFKEAILTSIIKHNAVNDTHLQIILEYLNPSTDLMSDIIGKARNAKTRLAIINHANTNETLYRSIAAMPDLSDDELKALFSKAQHSDILTEICLATLMDNHQSALYKTALACLVGTERQQERLIQLIDAHAFNQTVLITIFETYALNADLMHKIGGKITESKTLIRLIMAAGELVDDALLASILSRDDFTHGDELLLLMMKKAKGEALLQQFIDEHGSDDAMLNTILDTHDLTPDLMNKIAAKATEMSTLIRLIQDAGERVDDALFSSILNRKDLVYDDKCLLLIVQKAKDPKTVLPVISHPQTTKTILHAIGTRFGQDDEVFWALLNEQHKMNFIVFYGLLKQHVNMSGDRAKAFLEHAAKTSIPSETKDLKALQTSIERLRIRAYELIIDSLNKKEGLAGKCYKQAQAAFALHESLFKLTEDYAKADTPDKTALYKAMSDAINQSDPILKEDYYLKQILYDILNALCILVSVAKYAMSGEFRFRLFDAKPQTTRVIEEIEQKVEKKP